SPRRRSWRRRPPGAIAPGPRGGRRSCQAGWPSLPAWRGARRARASALAPAWARARAARGRAWGPRPAWAAEAAPARRASPSARRAQGAGSAWAQAEGASASRRAAARRGGLAWERGGRGGRLREGGGAAGGAGVGGGGRRRLGLRGRGRRRGLRLLGLELRLDLGLQRGDLVVDLVVHGGLLRGAGLRRGGLRLHHLERGLGRRGRRRRVLQLGLLRDLAGEALDRFLQVVEHAHGGSPAVELLHDGVDARQLVGDAGGVAREGVSGLLQALGAAAQA